ncbi:type I restriction endonuclease subunit R, EcoR124 family [Pontibacter brevis]
MELIKEAISSHSRLIPGIEGYLTLVDKVEKNVNINPDIAIESCKSLIEGLCLKALSLLSDSYISSKSTRTKCKNDLKVLTHMAFDEVYSNYVESQIHESLSNMLIDVSVAQKIKDNAKRKVKEQAVETIGKVSAIRNERGDISHGRSYPKEQESSIKLAKSISSITDGIGSFMIEEIATQYLAKLKEQDKLIYEDLADFNSWLDEKHHVLSIKIDFSKLLFENAYEKYEEFYFTEYVDLFETEQEIPSVETIVEAEPTPEETAIIAVEPVQRTEPVIETLVSNFNENEFWTAEKAEQLRTFSAVENLDDEKLEALINEFLFTEKVPLRDDVAETMNIKPALKDRSNAIKELTQRIVVFANGLKEPEQEV